MVDIEKKIKVEAVKTLKSAIKMHELGKWEEASLLYEWVKAVLVDNADCLAMLGLLRLQRGYYENALENFNRALLLNPEQPVANRYSAIADQKVRALTGAEIDSSIFKPEVHQGKKENHFADSENVDSSEDQLELNSLEANKLYKSYLVFEKRGKIIESGACLAAAIVLEPESPFLLFKYAGILQKLARWEEAIHFYSEGIKLNPMHGGAYNDRASVLYKSERYREALDDIEKAVELLPNHAQCHRNKGYILVHLKKPEEAVVSYSEAIKLDPESAETYNNLGMALESIGRFQEALTCYEDALSRNEGLDLVKYNKGLVLLRMGQFKEGWEFYEYRLNTELAEKERVYRYPTWDGVSDLKGKTILLHHEQGLGDTIHFCRYVSKFSNLGCSVVLEVQDPLVSLLSQFENDDLIVVGNGKEQQRIDLRCSLMSLPQMFETDLDRDSWDKPYLSVEENKEDYWKRKLGKTERQRVGLAWSGSATHNNDHARSIPLSDLLPLLDAEAEFHSLQKEVRDSDKMVLERTLMINDHSSDLKDFSDTAALISCLDLVITVDTSVAHLAGALGKKVWIMLPSWPDFRWMVERTDTPWYGTAKLFRQKKSGDWSGVVNNIALKLKGEEDSELESSKSMYVGTTAGELKFENKPISLNENQADLAILFKEALSFHQNGKLNEAERLYKDILTIQPKNYDVLTILGSLCWEKELPDEGIYYLEESLKINSEQPVALNNLGLCYQANDKLNEAQDSFVAALQIESEYADAHLNLGDVLSQMGEFQQALDCFDKVISINPNDADAYLNKGNTLKEIGKLDEAVRSYQKAYEIKPGFSDAHKHRANLLVDLERLDEGLEEYDSAIKFNQMDPDLFYLRGLLLIQLKRTHEASIDANRIVTIKSSAKNYERKADLLSLMNRADEAIVAYEKSIEIDPEVASAHSSCGVMLTKLERYEEGLLAYDEAIRLDANNALYYSNRGAAYADLGRLVEALQDSDKAIEKDGHEHEVYLNRGGILEMLGRFDEAEMAYDKAIHHNEKEPLSYWNKALLMLRLGRYKEGWLLYERRWQTQLFQKEKTYPYPLWDGVESLKGKTILMHHEQGFGDSIQFVRYASDLKALDAKVIVGVPDPLVDLFQHMNEGVKFVSSGAAFERIDYRVPMMSLPHLLDTRIESVPAEIPYLFADSGKSKKWKNKLGKKIRASKKRIGLVWSGQAKHARDYDRSVPLSLMKPIIQLGYEFHSLQKEVRQTDKEIFEGLERMQDHSDHLTDFSETAALIDNLDLIISVDTSVAHLAGAMGKPVWVLLPFVPDYRWLTEREDSPWYPTARLFRQSNIGEWSPVIQAITRELLLMFDASDGCVGTKSATNEE